MANLTNNRLNITATPVQIAAVKTALQTATSSLPFLIGLTTDERVSLPAIDVSNKAFTEDAINAGVNNASLLPGYISVPNMQNDLMLFTQIDEIVGVVKQLLEKLEDTQLLAGAEAYTSALMLYKMFGDAAESGMPGTDAIVAQLKLRFNNQGNNTPPKPVTP